MAHNSAAGASTGAVTLSDASESHLQINSGITIGNAVNFSSTNASSTVIRQVAANNESNTNDNYTVGSSQGLKSSFTEPSNDKPDTIAKILAGTNSGGATDLTMKFSTSLPTNPSNDDIRRTDIFTISGVSNNAATTAITGDTDTFVIQLSAAALATDSVWHGRQWDWVNAVAGNKGTNTSNLAYLNYQGSFADFLTAYTFNAATMLGAYGVGGNSVWAVVDHTGSFTAVPELSNFLIGGLLGIGLLRSRR